MTLPALVFAFCPSVIPVKVGCTISVEVGIRSDELVIVDWRGKGESYLFWRVGGGVVRSFVEGV